MGFNERTFNINNTRIGFHSPPRLQDFPKERAASRESLEIGRVSFLEDIRVFRAPGSSSNVINNNLNRQYILDIDRQKEYCSLVEQRLKYNCKYNSSLHWDSFSLRVRSLALTFKSVLSFFILLQSRITLRRSARATVIAFFICVLLLLLIFLFFSLLLRDYLSSNYLHGLARNTTKIPGPEILSRKKEGRAVLDRFPRVLCSRILTDFALFTRPGRTALFATKVALVAGGNV